MRSKTFALTIAFLAAVPALATANSALGPIAEPQAVGGPAPVSHAVPTASNWVWDGETGFDWAARENHTHVEIDASNPVNSVPLDPISTAYVDLEVAGLPADRPLKIARSDGRVYDDASYADGKLVVWHVPAVPLTVTITDAASGEVFTSAVMSVQMPMASSGTGSWARPCGGCGDYTGGNWQDSFRYRWERIDVPSYVNGVRSFTSDIVLRIDACWTHANTIHAKASGGYAAASGSAGGSRTREQRVCSSTSSTNGVGQISGPMQQFEKDTYSDGSWKVWSPAATYGYSSVSWDWNPHRGSYTLEFQNCLNNSGQFYSLTERNSGSIHWSASWHAWGVTGEAGTTSTDDNQATLKFECKASNDDFHRYSFLVIVGDGTNTGMVGAVWKDF